MMFSLNRLHLILPFCALMTVQLVAQQTFPVAAPSDERMDMAAFTHATIYTDYKIKVDNATLLIKGGKVVAAGTNITIPKGAVITDCTGKTIYPAFIDIYAGNYGLPAAPAAAGGFRNRAPQPLTAKTGAYSWNEAIKPEFSAAENFTPDAKAADEWRKLGFGALLTHQTDGIARGTGSLVLLADERAHENILIPSASNHLSFRKGSSKQDYPSSLMGCIALIRQTYYDAQWYQKEGYKTEYNASMEKWNQTLNLPQIFEASDKLDILRIAALGREFNLKYMVKTAGDEYQRLDEIKAAGTPLVVSLNFPAGYDVRDPYDAQNIALRELKHWEMAPSNAARLQDAGIDFALTTADLKDKSKFMANLRKAMEYGLSPENALKALTWQPAQMLHCYDQIGSLEPGKVANFIITSGNVFDADAKIFQTWSKGEAFIYKDFNETTPQNLFGEYQLVIPDAKTQTLVLQQKKAGVDAWLLHADSSKTKVNFDLRKNNVTLSFQQDTVSKKTVTMSGLFTTDPSTGLSTVTGKGASPDGRTFDWTLRQVTMPTTKPNIKQNPVKKLVTGDMMTPFIAFGQKEKPATSTFLIKNATVWTNEKEGILTNTDVLISRGKIQKIGRNLPVQDNATVIDGTGKHLTAGIIDEHSHIAIARSVNEGTQESSAEVRIGDALDSEDIDIYRQLAGGVTSSHLLHGSSNPIGGQTQLIKLRWGAAPEALKFSNWPGYIKFALGENVKQSNWGENYRSRYPQTRMGVEQVYVDYFTRAREYNDLEKSGATYRRDLDLEALAEILNSQRFITCHSYVQSEITMLMRVAERFGFKVNTFTHILEGYKVADKMAKHGAGASTFSDWWAYKMEVKEAIPYNAAIMHRQGVLVSINSDDAEMARRLNQEAGKVVEYGGVTEEEAWKMVTLNPAKLLRVDDRVGSIKTGKDADLVLWDNNPLSVYANAQTTWVDGTPYFDRKEDEKRREEIQAERARIIQKMLSEGKGGPGGDKPAGPRGHYHCDSDEDEG